MFELLGRVSATLGTVRHALIGAGAMSVAGYTRATQDLDLLVLNGRVLDREFWSALAQDCTIDIGDSRNEPDDPLLGVGRIYNDATGEQIDSVVGRSSRWQGPILERRLR